jgi:hypothetical protein
LPNSIQIFQYEHVKNAVSYGESNMPKTSNFRLWVENIWRENCQERQDWHDDDQTLAEYFQRYKWYLRREYRFQHVNNSVVLK